MRKPDQIRAIYAELRQVLGPEVPAGDLLKVAFIIFRSYNANVDELADFGRPRDSRSILYLPLDEAMFDGGWRILEFERITLSGSLDQEWPSLTLRSQMAEYLGPGWEHGNSK